MTRPGQYWFAAKRYGWGWGPPLTWHGWVVLIVWLAILTAAAMWLMPMHPTKFTVFTVIMVGILTLICYLKGEPPRWRWGD
jgi:hypothetical protein